jgi:hypothetical protein
MHLTARSPDIPTIGDWETDLHGLYSRSPAIPGLEEAVRWFDDRKFYLAARLMGIYPMSVSSMTYFQLLDIEATVSRVSKLYGKNLILAEPS